MVSLPPAVLERLPSPVVTGAIAGAVVLAACAKVSGSYCARKREAKKRADRLAGQRRGVVYLYQFKRPADTLVMSAFCGTVETFLRLCNIPHEVVESGPDVSPTGRLPYIELNGEGTVDSICILRRLREEFPEACKAVNDPLNAALSLVVARFVTRALRLHGHRHFWVDNTYGPVSPAARVLSVVPLPWTLGDWLIIKPGRKAGIQWLNIEGHGDLSDAEYHSQFLDEVKALEAIIAANDATASKERGVELSPETVATLFAWLEWLYGLPPCPAVRFLHQSAPLKRFLASMERRLYPDAAKLCPKRQTPSYAPAFAPAS